MVAAPSPFLSLPAGPHLRLATRSGSVLLLSLPAGSTVSSVPPDSHLSLSLSLGLFPARVPPDPSSRARWAPAPGRCRSSHHVPSPLYRSAGPLPPSFSFRECLSAIPFVSTLRSSKLARPHRPRAHLGRYQAAGAVHVAATAALTSSFHATTRRAAEPNCRHGAESPRHLLHVPPAGTVVRRRSSLPRTTGCCVGPSPSRSRPAGKRHSHQEGVADQRHHLLTTPHLSEAPPPPRSCPTSTPAHVRAQGASLEPPRPAWGEQRPHRRCASLPPPRRPYLQGTPVDVTLPGGRAQPRRCSRCR
jgi:hypothetical protein